MHYTRRGFATQLGQYVAGATASAAWAAASSPQEEHHEEHSKLPMTTHASGNSEDLLAAPEQVWAKLMEGNNRFVAGKTLVRDVVARRSAVLSGQQPQVIVLGCSDSRISPTLVFDQGLGDVLEVRTVGNVVDAVGLGSIEYALIHMPIRVLVVLGHERCGAVRAAAAGEKMATPNLQAIVDKIAPALTKLQGDHKSPEYLLRAVIANVLHSAADLLADSPIILRETSASNIEIIKATYSLATGKVTRISE